MKKRIILIAIILCSLTFAVSAFSQDAYVIGPGDKLEIKFWQDETNRLGATVNVRQDGTISLDIIGEIKAAGLTTAELEKNIVRQISRYNKAISQTVVRVVEYGHLKVYISGQVLNPGKYTFEKIPNLWMLINEAGGITEFGDLSRVLIIRGADSARRVEIVNVADAVSRGAIEELPKIFSGDAIEVSRMPAGLPARTLSLPTEARNVFYVTGAINTPGPHTLEENTDLLDAIAVAGGPAENADLEKVKVVSKDGFNAQVAIFNIKKYTESGTPGRYIVRPEDNIILERRRGGILGLGSMADVVTVLGAATTALILYDRLAGGE